MFDILFLFYIKTIIALFLNILLTLLPVLITVAFFTLFERKLLASIQRRRGPNVVGFWGLLQPIADGLKLVIKEFIIPQKSVFGVFIFSPI
jgi:NADH:ubiquinone oxidoreductase subunit H